MKPSDVTRALEILYPARDPLWLWGEPGIGKSDLARQAAARVGEFLDVRPLLHDPTDFKFPSWDPQKRVLQFINTVFPADPGWTGFICLEELAQCAALMQGALMQLTLDRRIGEYVLPDGAWVIACSNRLEDRAGVNRVISPLLNRFTHLDVEVSHDDWHAWAVAAGVDHRVRSFLKMRPGLLHQFKPQLNERAFPTPRSWHRVSNVLAANPPEDLQHPLFAGRVGDGPGAEFVGYLRLCDGLPDLDAIVAAPSTHAVPSNPSVLYALSGALVERGRKADAKTQAAVTTYAVRLPDEFAVLTFRDLSAVAPKILAIPQAGRWLETHRHLLKAGR